MKAKINDVEATEIYKDRFSYGIPRRSEAYKLGYSDKLQRVATEGKRDDRCPFAQGTVEFDAYFSGYDHADTSISCFVMNRDDPDKVQP